MKYSMMVLASLMLVSQVWAQSERVYYRWIDDQGGVHLSDTPVDGAKEIKLPAMSSYPSSTPASAPASAESTTSVESATEAKPKTPVEPPKFEWLSPTENQIVWSNLGEFSMRAKVLNLPNDFRFELTLNDQPVQPQSSGNLQELELQYSWSGLIVGEYRLRLKMLDSRNQLLLDSGDRTFYVRRNINRAPK